MAPQSRSSTCATCQKRKVKCDRQRPACSQCVKYKWVCPGYVTALKAQGGQELASSKDRRASSTAQLPQRPKAILSKRPSTSTSPPLIAPAFSFVFPPSSESSLLASRLAHCLSRSLPSSPLKRLGPFMDFVPTRIGINRGLDDTVRLICFAESSEFDLASFSPDSNRGQYYKALHSLRLSLQNETEALSSEVLCATVLLSWYEAYANEKADCWLTHTGGCSQLIQMRGPSRHVAGFERALLHGQQHLIVSETLIRQKPCFLDHPSWRKVLNVPVPGNVTCPEMDSQIISNSFLAALASFRRGVYDFQEIRDPDHRREALGQLLLNADRLRQDLKKGLDTKASATTSQGELVIFVKNALCLIVADAVLVDLYRFSSDIPGDQAEIGIRPTEDCLHIEVAETFKHVYADFEVAADRSPVETGQLLLVVRWMCTDMLQIYGHPKHMHLWARLEEVVQKIDSKMENERKFRYKNPQTWNI